MLISEQTQGSACAVRAPRRCPLALRAWSRLCAYASMRTGNASCLHLWMGRASAPHPPPHLCGSPPSAAQAAATLCYDPCSPTAPVAVPWISSSDLLKGLHRFWMISLGPHLSDPHRSGLHCSGLLPAAALGCLAQVSNEAWLQPSKSARLPAMLAHSMHESATAAS